MIQEELNNKLRIISILEKKKKEQLAHEILTNGLTPFEAKYNTYKFK